MTDAPRPGATCAEHPEYPALAVCPSCARDVCVICWHAAVSLCQACLARDPAQASPPVPWEMPHLGVIARFFETVKTAFYPAKSAPAFARAEIRPAITFFLLSFLPLALVRGVIPFTETLLFEPGLRISVQRGASQFDIAIDVLRAVGFSLGLSLLALAAIALPFISLARSYGTTPFRNAAVRLMLYRGFLLGFSMQGVLFYGTWWVAPKSFAETASLVALFVEVVPMVLLFWSMRSTARMAHGVGLFASLLVVLVPLFLVATVYSFAGFAIRLLLPSVPDLFPPTVAPEHVPPMPPIPQGPIA